MATVKLIWDGRTSVTDPNGNTITQTPDPIGTLKEGESFANYTGVYFDGDSDTYLPIGFLRQTSYRIYIESDTRWSEPPDDKGGSTPQTIWGIINQPVVSEPIVSEATFNYYRWLTSDAPFKASLNANWEKIAAVSLSSEWDATTTYPAGGFARVGQQLYRANAENTNSPPVEQFIWRGGGSDTTSVVTGSNDDGNAYYDSSNLWVNTDPLEGSDRFDPNSSETLSGYPRSGCGMRSFFNAVSGDVTLTRSGGGLPTVTATGRFQGQSCSPYYMYFRIDGYNEMRNIFGTSRLYDRSLRWTLSPGIPNSNWTPIASTDFIETQPYTVGQITTVSNPAQYFIALDRIEAPSSGTNTEPAQDTTNWQPVTATTWDARRDYPANSIVNYNNQVYTNAAAIPRDVRTGNANYNTSRQSMTLGSLNGQTENGKSAILTVGSSSVSGNIVFRSNPFVSGGGTGFNVGSISQTRALFSGFGAHLSAFVSILLDNDTPNNDNRWTLGAPADWSGTAEYARDALVNRGTDYFRCIKTTVPPQPTRDNLASWDRDVDQPVPTLQKDQISQEYLSIVDLLNAQFNSSQPVVLQTGAVRRLYYRWLTNTTRTETAPPTPTTTDLSQWSIHQPETPDLVNEGDTRHLYTSEITTVGSMVIRATVPVRVTAESEYLDRYYKWEIGADPSASTPTANTLAQWSTTPPTDPVLVGIQFARLFYSDVRQNYDGDTFESATTPVLNRELESLLVYNWQTANMKMVANPPSVATPITVSALASAGWTETQPDAPSIANRFESRFLWTIRVVKEGQNVVSLDAPVRVQSESQFIQPFFFRITQVPPITAPATPTSATLSTWSTTEPALPTLTNTQASNLYESRVLRLFDTDANVTPFTATTPILISHRGVGLAGFRDTASDVKLYDSSTGNQLSNQIQFSSVLSFGNVYADSVISDGSTVWYLSLNSSNNGNQNWLRAYTLSTGARDTTKDVKLYDSSTGNQLSNQIQFSSDLSFGRVSADSVISDGSTVWYLSLNSSNNGNQNWLRAYTLSTGARDTTKDVKLYDSSTGNQLSNQIQFSSDLSFGRVSADSVISDGSTVWYLSLNSSNNGNQNWLRAYTLSTGARDTTKDVKLYDSSTGNQLSNQIQFSSDLSFGRVSADSVISDGSTIWYLSLNSSGGGNQYWLRAYTLSTGARDTTKDVKLYDSSTGNQLSNQIQFSVNLTANTVYADSVISDGSTVWYLSLNSSSNQFWLRAFE